MQFNGSINCKPSFLFIYVYFLNIEKHKNSKRTWTFCLAHHRIPRAPNTTWCITDVPYIIAERTNVWTSGFLDEFQAAWRMVSNASDSMAYEDLSHLSIRRSLVTWAVITAIIYWGTLLSELIYTMALQESHYYHQFIEDRALQQLCGTEARLKRI